MSYPLCGDKVILNKTPNYEYQDPRYKINKGMTGRAMEGSGDRLTRVKFKEGFIMWIDPVDLDIIRGYDHLISRA